MTPPPKQGPCSGSAREGSTPGVTAKTSGLLSAGASEKQVENFEGGPGQERGAELYGKAVLEKSHEFRRVRLECRIDERGGGVCQPGLACANGVADSRKSFSE